MPRVASPFYYPQDAALGAAVGQSLGTALFGDPTAAAKLALQRGQLGAYDANAQESTANALLANAKTAEQEQETGGARKLSDIYTSFNQPPAPIGTVDPLAVLPPTGPTPEQIHAALPAMMAAMVLAKGNNLPVGETIAQLPAYSGDTNSMRGAMVGQGKDVNENFAGTDAQADHVLNVKGAQDYKKSTDVARINHETDIPIARIQQQTTERGQNMTQTTAERGQDLEHGDRVRGQDLTAGGGRTGGWTPRFSDGGNNADRDVDGKELAMSQRLGIAPDATLSRAQLPAVFDAIASTEGANPHNGNPGNIVDGAFARSQPGYVGNDGKGFAVFNSPAAGRAAGIALLQTYHGRGQNTIRSIVEGLPTKPPKPPKAPSQISAADNTMLDNEVNSQLEARGLAGKPDAGTMVRIRQGAAARFQETGNPAQAVSDTLDELQSRFAAKQGKGKTQTATAPAATPAAGTPAYLKKQRTDALAAINQGADPTAVKQRFKKLTGQDLAG